MGAAMVMLMRRSSALTVAGRAMIEYFRQVPQVRYAKVEVPQAADKLNALIELGAGGPAGAFHPDPLPLP
jgi:hypothetical protein